MLNYSAIQTAESHHGAVNVNDDSIIERHYVGSLLTKTWTHHTLLRLYVHQSGEERS